MVKIVVPEYLIEDYVEKYLKDLFGAEVVWSDKLESLRNIYVEVEEYADGRPISDLNEDEW